MKIILTKNFFGELTSCFQLPLEDDYGRPLTPEQISTNVSAVVAKMKREPTITFFINSLDFPAAWQEYLKPIYSQKNIEIG